MFAYIVRRLAIGVVMLIVMSIVTFLLFFAAPGDPAKFACGKSCTPELHAQTMKSLGYDKPITTQYVKFVKGVFAGRSFPDDPAIAAANPALVSKCPAPCLGYSPYEHENVTDIIKAAIPISISIALMAFVMWMVGGVLFGVAAALRAGTVVDRGIVGFSLVLYAFPTFFTGLLLYYFVSIKWQILPIPAYTPLAQDPFQWFVGLLLPGLTLAVFYMAAYVRITRAYVLEAFGEDYVRTARAKGLPQRKIVFKHAMRAALTPLVTMSGLDLAGLMGGAIITENVFNYPGLGYTAVKAVQNMDLPVTVAIVLLLSAFVIIANILVDVAYAYIDPRVRLD